MVFTTAPLTFFHSRILLFFSSCLKSMIPKKWVPAVIHRHELSRGEAVSPFNNLWQLLRNLEVGCCYQGTLFELNGGRVIQAKDYDFCSTIHRKFFYLCLFCIRYTYVHVLQIAVNKASWRNIAFYSCRCLLLFNLNCKFFYGQEYLHLILPSFWELYVFHPYLKNGQLDFPQQRVIGIQCRKVWLTNYLSQAFRLFLT